MTGVHVDMHLGTLSLILDIIIRCCLQVSKYVFSHPHAQFCRISQHVTNKSSSKANIWSRNSSKVAKASNEQLRLRPGDVKIPDGYAGVQKSQYKIFWEQAMKSELDSLEDTKTWEEASEAEYRGKNLIKTRWVFTVKTGPDGTITRFKARVVAQGFSQVEGIDYFETFSPTLSFEALRVMLAIGCMSSMIIHQIDIKTAFLNSDIDTEVFVKPPQGYHKDDRPVMRLRKSLYGLKQSPRNWHFRLKEEIERLSFQVTEVNQNIFVRDAGGDIWLWTSASNTSDTV
ncbi:hypothetical protein TRVA0_106S00122 [Trichomonascus vanleenenianus]|uniref:uncharacterized protein n=1 Tax=Trichomonascus vanleenenianus TaxID=2268995 RepID=UPI003ECAA711